MTARKIKYGKIAIVVFLTALIWVWADLAQDESLPVSNVTIVAKSTDPSLWVSFDGEPSVSIANIVLEGPASKVTDVGRMQNQGSLNLEFFLVPEQEGMTEPGNHPLDVLSFLRRSDKIKELGLTVESCEPDKLTVNVVKLVKKSVTVQCFDENGMPLKAESIKPSTKVDAFVLEDWAGEKLITKVQLTSGEINQARLKPIPKRPYVELAPGQTREVLTTVQITMPPAEDVLRDYLITATLGIALSPNLQPKYRVELTNLNEVISPIAIRATAEARRAYEAQPYPLMTLYILDDDEKIQGEQRREVVYNLPEEFVQSGQIMSPQPPAQARFKLVPLSSEAP